MTPAGTDADQSPLSHSARPGRDDLMAEACPSREVLRHVTSRRGVLVLLALEAGTLRFGELRWWIGGVSERMLAQTLHWLDGDGLVDRVAHAVVPPHVEYSLTPLGREGTARVRALADWVEASLSCVAATPRERERRTDRPTSTP